MTALYFGYDKCYMKDNSREDIRMWLQALAIISVSLTLIGATRAAFNHLRTAKKT